jgi:hypothetical protein
VPFRQIAEEKVRGKDSNLASRHFCTGVSWIKDDAVEVTMQPARVSASEVATGTESKARPSLVIGNPSAKDQVITALTCPRKGLHSELPFGGRLHTEAGE